MEQQITQHAASGAPTGKAKVRKDGPRKKRENWDRAPRTRRQPNALRDWLEADPPPMSKGRFADLLEVSGPYVSMLVGDNAPWPGRDIARRIAIITDGAVTPNDLAGLDARRLKKAAAR